LPAAYYKVTTKWEADGYNFIQTIRENKMRKIGLIIFASLLFTNTTRGRDHMDGKTELATFGGGCFWCVEAIFDRVTGVQKVISGYSGGTVSNPTYKQITTGSTGHAEVVQIRFDPNQISYLELLEIFFKTHDPTTLNRQGPDVGTQYRSIVLYHTQEQRIQAQEVIEELNEARIWESPIVTQVVPFETFYTAENYHQEYFENNPNQGYCRMVVQPKVEKFEKIFSKKLK